MVSSTNGFGGGGGGWYGGGGGHAGGGGSGYVYTSSTASNYPSGCQLNSSYYLTDAQTIAGDVSFPAPNGGTETGHIGNGFARITAFGAGIGCPSETAVVNITVTPPVAPDIASAEISCGEEVTLQVQNAYNNLTYMWYDDPECTNLVHTGTSLTLSYMNADTTFYVKSFAGSEESAVDFDYTGSVQSWTVPAGGSQVQLEVWGAQGGDAT